MIGANKKRIGDIERTLEEVLGRLDALELMAADHAPASEVERLNHAFDLIAARAPISEVERLDKAFELISEASELIENRAPASETERLDRAFELISGVFNLLSEKAPLSEVDRLNYAIELIANHRPSERIVEIPWALSKYRGEPRVLEVGYAFAEEHYLRSLVALDIPQLVGVDAAVSPRPDALLKSILEVRGDVLQHCFKPASFDLILCVSTIEHIGRDNTVYGLDSGRDIEYPDIVAIKNMSDWLAPRGRLLVTVPFGRYEDHGWLINYDIERLDALIDASALRPVEQRFYGWMPGGWREVEPEILAGRGYQSLGASHAAGVALVELQKVSEAS